LLEDLGENLKELSKKAVFTMLPRPAHNVWVIAVFHTAEAPDKGLRGLQALIAKAGTQSSNVFRRVCPRT
jgi:hypothetical protein